MVGRVDRVGVHLELRGRLTMTPRSLARGSTSIAASLVTGMFPPLTKVLTHSSVPPGRVIGTHG